MTSRSKYKALLRSHTKRSLEALLTGLLPLRSPIPSLCDSGPPRSELRPVPFGWEVLVLNSGGYFLAPRVPHSGSVFCSHSNYFVWAPWGWQGIGDGPSKCKPCPAGLPAALLMQVRSASPGRVSFPRPGLARDGWALLEPPSPLIGRSGHMSPEEAGALPSLHLSIWRGPFLIRKSRCLLSLRTTLLGAA